MTWPLEVVCANGLLRLPGPGCFALDIALEEHDFDDLLAGARACLGKGAVGWVPANGGLLSNLPAWENVLLATQWHAPASLAALEARILAWCLRLGYDEAGAALLMSCQPARLDDDELRVLGWLRQLLSRPKLVLLEGRALPDGAVGDLLLTLLAEELASSLLLVVDGAVPVGFVPLSLQPAEAETP